MKRLFGGLALALAVSHSVVARSQPLASRALGKVVTSEYQLAAGLEARLWAESPQLHNPTNMDIDARGRVWVTEGVNYRQSIRPHNAKTGYLERAGGDRVVILEDTDGDGAADSSKVFVEDKDLVAPLGIAVLGKKVIVSSSPNVIVYTDEDGDDKPDRKEILLEGFGGVDHDHGVHAFVFGPDGRLYFPVGNAGPHVVESKKGSATITLRSTNDGPGDKAQPSLGGRTWVQGLVLSVAEDGSDLRVHAHNFRNNYELAIDAFGNIWQNDNDDDGNQSCRMTFVLEGGSYGYTSANGRRGWRADQRVGQPTPVAHWHLEDPGTAPPTEITGAGSPTGIAVYEGGLLPASFRGLVLNADAGRSTIFGHAIAPAGAGHRSTRTDFFASRAALGDEARRFRPSDVAVGPDGAIYVADWYDPVVGGHNMRDKAGHGRIFRIAPAGSAPRAPSLRVETPSGLVDALLSPAPSVRYLGWHALKKAATQEGVRAAVFERLGDRDPRVRARLLWVLPRLGAEGRDRLFAALADRDPDVRLAAFRVYRGTGNGWLARAATLAKDPSAAIRREVAVSLRDVPASVAVPILTSLAAGYDGKDRMMLEAIGIGAQDKESALYAPLAARAGKDPLRWPGRFVDLVWRLHPAESVAGLRARAESPRLSLHERQRALVALAFVPHREAAAAVLAVAEKGAEPLKSYALDLAFDRGGAEWASFGVSERVAALSGAGARPEANARIEGLKKVAFQSSMPEAERIKALEALAGDGEGGRFLLGLAAQKKLPEEAKATVAAAIFRNPDVGVRALASQYFTRPAFEGVAYPPISELAKMKSDAGRGRTVFFSPTAACAQCHQYGNEGRSVGPALTEIAGKLGREALLDAILNPSAGIAFGYDAWVITTKDDQTFTGFILGEGDNVLLKNIAGEHQIIPAKEIAHRQREKASIMPDNIALGMKPQELVDLVEFLASGRGGKAKR